MKKTISLAFIGAALLALAACSDDTETKLLDTPVVTLSPSSVTLSAEAVESYTINYTVANAASGATVSATADASWVTVVDTSVSGQIRLSVGANASEEMRTATLTVTYSYDGGAVTAMAAIVQYGAGDPVLSVDPNAIVATFAGGEYSFGYSVDNPIDGEEVDCTADADWISGFDYSVWGTVTFTVASNADEELRSAVITVTYAGLEAEVDVVQDRVGNPSFRVETTTVKADGAGGEYSFGYTLKDAIDGLSVECTSAVDWISDFADDGEGTVTFTVAANGLDEKRTGTITATYYGIEREVTVNQKKKPDSGTWSEYGTGDYFYSGLYYYETIDRGLKIYQNSDNKNRFKIEGWAKNSELLFTWDQDDNSIVLDEEQETGETYSSYGDVYVKDLTEDFPDITMNGCPGGFEEDGVLYLAIDYYCSGGYFGFGYDTFTLSTATSSKPALSDVAGTYSITGWSVSDESFSTATYVLAESNDDSKGNIMFTTFDDTTITPGSSSSGGSGGGPGGGGGGGTTVTYTYIYGTYDETTGVVEFENEQLYTSQRSGMTTYYVFFETYYESEPKFLVFNNGAIWGPFYGDFIEEAAYSLSQNNFSYQGFFEAYMYMYGTKASSPSSLSTKSSSGSVAPVSGSLATPHLNFTPVKLNK